MPLSPLRWQQIQTLLDDALDVSPGDRAALIERACVGDPELRAQVERLLEACDPDSRILEQPVLEAASGLISRIIDLPQPIRDRIGPYRIIRETGRGGMGTVFLAERSDGQYEHRVALKLMRQSLDRSHAIRRFLDERQILASMEHPDIARLLDGGVTEDGLPYLVMEFVDGIDITIHCDERLLRIADRLRLFCRVCDAVQYAHSRLVVHRDLKPSNILITADGSVKLLDFGIAKLLSADAPGSTTTDVRRMTPEYASPEQVRNEAISTASDVYSLGVLLYRLLTGHSPYRCDDRGAWALERAVLELEPARPSATVTPSLRTAAPGGGDDGTVQRAAVRGESPGALRRLLAGDLDAITLRALEKDPTRRYASAEQLAADVRRHVAALPVHARPITARYRLGRFVRRNRVWVAAAGVAALSLAVAGVLAASQARRATAHARLATAERDRANLEAEHAEQVARFLIDLFDASSYDTGGDTLTARQLLERGAARIGTELAGQPAKQARMLTAIGASYASFGLPAEARTHLERAVALSTAVHGPEHPDVARGLNALGNVFAALSEFDSAVATQVRVLDFARGFYGDTALETMAIRNDLGLALQLKGRFAEAESLFHQVLAYYRGRREHDLPRAMTLSNLGWTMEARGNLAAAESAFAEALHVRRERLGERHPRLALSMYNLSNIQIRRGNFGEAEPLARAALQMNRDLFGDQHAPVAADLLNLATLMQRSGRLQDAQPLYQEALALTIRTRGADGLGAGRVANDYAGLLMRLGDYRQATAHYTEALRVYTLRLGDGHPFTAVVRGNLAGGQLVLGNVDAAEQQYRQALAELRAARGEEDVLTATVTLGLGQALHARRDHVAAEALLRAALDVRRRRLEPGHWQIAEAEAALGSTLTQLGMTDEAEPLLAGAYAVLRVARGEDGPEARRTRAALIALFERTGRRERADTLRARPTARPDIR